MHIRKKVIFTRGTFIIFFCSFLPNIKNYLKDKACLDKKKPTNSIQFILRYFTSSHTAQINITNKSKMNYTIHDLNIGSTHSSNYTKTLFTILQLWGRKTSIFFSSCL